MPEQIYEIVRVDPKIYLNAGQAVNGYRIVVRWIVFNETIEIDVPNLNNTQVNDAIMAVYRERVKLTKLGSIEDITT